MDADPGSWLVGIARVGPVVVWLFLVGRLPLALSLLVSMGMALLVAPGGHLSQLPRDGIALVALCARELAIGVLLGAVAALPVRALEALGRMLDIGGLGREALEGGDAEVRGSLESGLGLFGLVVFLSIGGLEIVLAAMAESYRLLPVGVPLSARAPAAAITVSGRLVVVSIRATLPVLATVALVRTGIAAAHRIESRVLAGIGEAAIVAWVTLATLLAVLVSVASSLATSESGRVGEALFRVIEGLAR